MKICALVLPLTFFFLVPLCYSQSALSANAELERLYSEDQADRASGSVDWNVVKPRDEARYRRVLELYQGGLLSVGKDFYHAAMILQHGDSPEDYLLSHELCVTAVFAHSDDPGAWIKGAKWLAAASEDRFLQSIGRKQRFGTQFRTVFPDPTWHLGEIQEGVSDGMRKSWSVPSLDEAKKREGEMNREAQKKLSSS